MGLAGRDHGEAVLVFFDEAVEDHRTLVIQHLHDRVIQIGGVGAEDALAAEGLGQFDEIGQCLGPAVRIAFAVQQFLPLADHAEAFVVHDELLDGQAVLHRGAHLLHVHQPGRLAGDIDDQRIRMRDLHADRGRRAVAHGAETARGHPPVRVLEAQVLRSPHLVLAHLGTDVAVMVLGQGLQPFQRVLRFDGLFRVGVGKAFDGPPCLDLLPPGLDGGGVGLAPARLPDPQHVFQHMGDIADDRKIGVDHLVDRGRVDIDMGLAAVRREIGDAPGDAVVEARADIDHQVAAMHREIGLIEPVHPEHPEPVLARGRVGPEAHQGGGDREPGGIDQFAQQRAGLVAGIDHAAAGIEDRAFGLFHRLDERGDGVDVALHLGLVMADLGFRFFDIGAGGELHVLGNVDQNRAGAALGRDVKGLVQDIGQVVGVLDQPVHLGAGARDAHGVGLLEGVGADHEGRNLPGENDDGDRIHQGVRQTGNGIGRPGAGGDQNDAGLAGRPGIAFGGMDRALFVAHQDVADLVLLKDLVIDRKDGAAGIAEYSIDALFFQSFDNHLRTGHLACHGGVLPLGLFGPWALAAGCGSGKKKPPVGSGGAWGQSGVMITIPCASVLQVRSRFSRKRSFHVGGTVKRRARGVNAENVLFCASLCRYTRGVAKQCCAKAPAGAAHALEKRQWIVGPS